MSTDAAAVKELPFFDPSAGRTPMIERKQFNALIDIPLSLISLHLSPADRDKHGYGADQSALTNLSSALKQFIVQGKMLAKVAQAALDLHIQRLEAESAEKLVLLGEQVLPVGATEDEQSRQRHEAAVADKYRGTSFGIQGTDDRLTLSASERADARVMLKRFFSLDTDREALTAHSVVKQLSKQYNTQNKNPWCRYNQLMRFILKEIIQITLANSLCDERSEILLEQLTDGLISILVTREDALVFAAASEKYMAITRRPHQTEDLTVQLRSAVGKYEGLISDKTTELMLARTDQKTAYIAKVVLQAITTLSKVFMTEDYKYELNRLRQSTTIAATEAAEAEAETVATAAGGGDGGGGDTTRRRDTQTSEGSNGGLFAALSRLSISGWMPNLFSPTKTKRVIQLGKAIPADSKIVGEDEDFSSSDSDEAGPGGGSGGGGGKGEEDPSPEEKAQPTTTADDDDTAAEAEMSEHTEEPEATTTPTPRSLAISGDAPPVVMQANPVQTYIMLRKAAAKQNPTVEHDYNREHKNNLFSRFNAGHKIDAAVAFLTYLGSVKSQATYEQLRPHIPALCNKSLADASVLKLKDDSQLAVDERTYENTPSSQLMQQWLRGEETRANNRHVTNIN